MVGGGEALRRQGEVTHAKLGPITSACAGRKSVSESRTMDTKVADAKVDSKGASKAPWQHDLYELLRRHGITQFGYVPDAGHAVLIDRSIADPDVSSVALTTEEEGVALLAGADLGAERRLGEADGHLANDVVALAREQGMCAHAQDHVQVARGTTVLPRFAFTAQLQP